jgi:phosphoglycerate dehydrogenase-like enzyme
MKIGVIGLGIVGETIYSVLKLFHGNVKGYDKYKPSARLLTRGGC